MESPSKPSSSIPTGPCFLCSSPSSHHCPYCGEHVCSPVHYEYHRPAGEQSKISESVPSCPDSSMCQPFRLKFGNKGRYLIATRDIKPLELIMTDRPCVVGPPAKTVPICLECVAAVSPPLSLLPKVLSPPLQSLLFQWSSPPARVHSPLLQRHHNHHR